MPSKRLPYPFVEPDAVRLTRLEIEALAEKHASEWGYRDGSSMEEVSKNAGVDIEYSHPPNEILLEVPLDMRPIVWLPRKGRKKDDRVTVATGFGHWVLHIQEAQAAHPGCGIQALYDPTSPEARAQAQEFGLAFLMPSNAFTEAWCEGRSQAVADRFDVPTTMTYLRAKSLDLGHAL